MVRVCAGCLKEDRPTERHRVQTHIAQEAENTPRHTVVTFTNITENQGSEGYSESIETENQEKPPTYEEFMRDEREEELSPPKYEDS